MLSLRRIMKCFWSAAVRTVDHDGIEHAGYLAFLSLLGIFPFLVLIVSIAGFLGQSAIGADFVQLMESILPHDVYIALEPRIHEIISGPPQGLLTLAILGAIWTASSGLEGLRTILNRAYHVGNPPAYILRRLLSILQLLVLTAFVVIGMFLLLLTPRVWAGFEAYIGIAFNLSEAWENLRLLISSGLLLFVACVAYYAIPNVRQRLRSVLPGALMSVTLWIGAAYGFTQYLTNFNQVSLIYGSLGGIIAALLFFYLMALIFIFGAEFNYALMKASGDKIEQKEATAEKNEVEGS
jgi:membrane protein